MKRFFHKHYSIITATALMLLLVMAMGLYGCGSKATPAQTVLAQFKEIAESAESTEVIANELMQMDIIAFKAGVMPVEAGYLSGFTEEITGFAEGTMFGPMISSIPFIGYVFEVEEGTDVDAFVTKLKDCADLRWNVCTEADELVCEAVGNRICFVMAPKSFEK